MYSLEAAALKDLNSLVNLEENVFSESDSRISRRSFRYHLKKKSAMWVLREEKPKEEIAGYFLLFQYKRNTRLYSIAVAPEYQGKGLAKILLHKAINVSRDLGKNYLYLEVRESNERAIKLYAQAGFHYVNNLPAYYKDGENGLRLRLNLR